MKKILILLLLMTTQLHAAELGIITASKHFDTEKDYNENNPGAYIIHHKYLIGAYKNSYSVTTMYVGKVVAWQPHKRVKLSLGYGVSYGYGWDNGLADPNIHGVRPLLFVLPTISISNRGYYFNTHIVGNAVAWSISKEW